MIDNIFRPSPTRPLPTFPDRDTESLIRVSHLFKQFDLKSGPVEILRDVSFEVPNENFVIVFGPSGSGKSTLLNILAGLERPTKGRIKIAGQNLYALNTDQRAHFRAQTIGIVHQQNYWINSLNVLENVAMPLYLTGSPKESALIVALDSLRKVGMEQYKDYLPTILSGGEQQRVSMARALVASPKLIIADEPTGDLDSKNGQMIINLLLYFQHELKRTIMLVTHNLEYLALSNTQLHILDGKVAVVRPGYRLPANVIDSLKLQIAALTKMGGQT